MLHPDYFLARPPAASLLPLPDHGRPAGHLAMNLFVQVVAIVTMRSIGLFYRHYGCYFKW